MQPAYFTPHQPVSQARARGCFTCQHFHGGLMAGHVICEHRGVVQVIESPRMGCAFWQREPGADDE
jgi:hypothetical protein